MATGSAATYSPSHSPELRLVHACTRTYLDRPNLELVNVELRKNVDFAKLLTVATHHGVVPLLYHNLASLAAGRLPADFVRQLQAHACLNAELNHRHARELVWILGLLRSHRIEGLSFKGVALAASVYGSLSLRKAGDLDILMRREEAVTARDLLLRNGYECRSQASGDVVPDRFGPFEFKLQSADGKVGVELRWKTTPALFADFDLDLVHEYRQSVLLDGCRVSVPAPEENLILLCIHGCKHAWSRLLWICDVAELVRACPGLDWWRVRRRAAEFRLWRAVKLGLLLGRDVLQTSLPADIAEEVASDSLVRRLAARVCQRLRAEVAVVNAYGRVFEPQLLNNFSGRMQWRLHRLSHLLTPTERDREIIRIPESLSRLYCVLRPFRLAAEYGVVPLAQTIWGRRTQR